MIVRMVEYSHDGMGWALALVFTILMFGSFGLFGWYVYDQVMHIGDFIEFCQQEGYDGIRYEKVNFMRDEPRCTNFTPEDRYKMREREEFNKAGQDVWEALTFKGTKQDA